MASRRTWLGISGLLIALLLGVVGYAWHSWNRFLEDQGITGLAWRDLELTTTGLSLGHLALERQSGGGRLQLVADRIRLDWPLPWGDAPPVRHVRAGRLQIDWWPAATDGSAGREAILAPQQWLDVIRALPRSVQVEDLSVTLPCATGRCRLEGSLALRRGNAPLPVQLELTLHHQDKTLNLKGNLSGSAGNLALKLHLDTDGEPRLTLDTRLKDTGQGRLWSGELAVPALPETAWLRKWIAEWRGPPEQPLPDLPQAPQIAADWRLRLPPGPLDRSALEKTAGEVGLELHLPTPWPVPGIATVQGRLAVELTGKQGQWYPRQLKADLHLSQLPPDWLAALPEPLRPETLTLKIAPTQPLSGLRPSLQGRSLPLKISVSSSQADLNFQATLAAASRPPWEAQLATSRLRLQWPHYSLAGWRAQDLSADLRLAGYINSNGLDLTLGEGSVIALSRLALQATAGDETLSLHQVSGNLDGLRVSARYPADPEGSPSVSVSGPIGLDVQRLTYPFLQPQSWHWTGNLEASLAAIDLNGRLSANSGLALDLQLRKTIDGPLTLAARLQDILFPTGNPLAATLADWPRLLALDSGRLQAYASATLPDGGAPLEANLDLELTGASGIYDRIALSGLDGHLRLQVRDDRLRLRLPEFQLDEANPGIPIGPVHVRGNYAAALAHPLQGRLELERAEAAFLGGRLWLEPAVWDLSDAPLLLPVQIAGLELSRLFAVYPAEGLAGRGVLDGELPVLLGTEGIRVEDGYLAARDGGYLRYRSEKIRSMARANPAMKLVANALEDFHYSVLSTDISYDDQGTLLLALRLEGRNPDLENGRPIHLNINLEENVPALLASLQLSGQVNDTIRKRVREALRERDAGPPP